MFERSEVNLIQLNGFTSHLAFLYRSLMTLSILTPEKLGSLGQFIVDTNSAT